VKETETVASASGIQLQRLDVNRSWDLERAFEAAMLGQVDALIPVAKALGLTVPRSILVRADQIIQ
jgi:ABC-type uncharacterized transport system substrate-binding protein